MGSRMDKYNREIDIPKRSDKNKELYKQIYNAYDEFENLVVPSNVKEIDLTDFRYDVVSRDDYKKVKDYNDITNTNNKIVRKEIVLEEQKKENEIYDINELLNKALKDKKSDEVSGVTISSDSYLKKLNLDQGRINLDMTKDIYEDIKKEYEDEISNEELIKTANLSLDILSDLKSDNDNTMVEAPIKDEFLDNDNNKFYSNEYQFSKKDFLDNDNVNDDGLSKSGNGKVFLKIFILIFIFVIIMIIIIYLLKYFNRI